jgi:hypothetical protein
MSLLQTALRETLPGAPDRLDELSALIDLPGLSKPWQAAAKLRSGGANCLLNTRCGW